MSVPYLNFTADSHQLPNISGGTWLIKINCNSFIKPWPLSSDIVNGYVVNMPLLRADSPIEIITPTPGTLYHKDASLGRHGYQFFRHEVGYEIAGDTIDVDNELVKDINSRAVFILAKPDGRLVLLGTASNGLMIQNDSDSGVESGENKTTVLAVSNVNKGKKSHISQSLEAAIMAGHDGYGYTVRKTPTPVLSSATTITYDILDAKTNTDAGRKFAVNDSVKLLGVTYNSPNLEILDDTKMYATATVSAVSNTIGLTGGLVNVITLNNIVWHNKQAEPGRVILISRNLYSVGGRFTLQKL